MKKPFICFYFHAELQVYYFTFPLEVSSKPAPSVGLTSHTVIRMHVSPFPQNLDLNEITGRNYLIKLTGY